MGDPKSDDFEKEDGPVVDIDPSSWYGEWIWKLEVIGGSLWNVG